MYSRFVRLFTFAMVLSIGLAWAGYNPIAAQSHTRNYQGNLAPNTQQPPIRRPQRFERSYGPKLNAGSAASPTSPRLQQYRSLNESRSDKTTPKRPSRPSYAGTGSIRLPTTGLNPSTNTGALDPHIDSRLRRSPSKSSSSTRRLTKPPLPVLEDIVFDSEERKLARRQWVDNTGTFTTVGRMIEIRGQSIRLMKENGRTATVPVRRLSVADIKYVTDQVKLQVDDQT